MIAIPDFSAGAMENWGLITYRFANFDAIEIVSSCYKPCDCRETALLFKDGVSNANNRERIAIVISHELAHQWFGNLVTPR